MSVTTATDISNVFKSPQYHIFVCEFIKIYVQLYVLIPISISESILESLTYSAQSLSLSLETEVLQKGAAEGMDL